MIFVTDEFGKITGVSQLSDSFFDMSDNKDILMPYRHVAYGNIGNSGSGFCYTNHVHPYSREWMYDSKWTNLVEQVNILQNSISVRIRQGILDFTVALTNIAVYLIRIYLRFLSGLAELLPELIPFFLLILEAIAGLGGHILKGEDGKEYEIEKMIEELEKMTK
jgi:hypothetical protein